MKSILMAAAAIAGAGSASASIAITEYLYSAGSGAFEYVELTNVGAAPIDMTGWSYDDVDGVVGKVDLSAFSVVAPGESVVFTESTAATFRTRWGLAASVKVIGGVADNLGRNDTINVWDNNGVLVDKLAFGDQDFPGTVRAQARSAWAYRTAGSGPFGNIDLSWVLSSAGDAQNSFAASGDTGSPGSYVPTPGSAMLMVAAAGLLRRRRA